jgi:hypothetical protein
LSAYKGSQRPHLIGSVVFEIPRGYLHVPATETHKIGKPHVGTHLDLVSLSSGYRGSHNSRVPGMKSTGYIGGTDQRQHCGIVPVSIKSKTFAHVAVDVNLKCHGSVSFSVLFLGLVIQGFASVYAKAGCLTTVFGFITGYYLCKWSTCQKTVVFQEYLPDFCLSNYIENQLLPFLAGFYSLASYLSFQAINGPALPKTQTAFIIEYALCSLQNHCRLKRSVIYFSTSKAKNQNLTKFHNLDMFHLVSNSLPASAIFSKNIWGTKYEVPEMSNSES